MQKCRVLLVRVARSPREGEAIKLGRHSIRSCQHVHVWSSRACSLRQGWTVVCRSRRRRGSGGCYLFPCTAWVHHGCHGLRPDVHFFGVKSCCHCTRRTSVPVGYLLPRSQLHCPNLLWSGRGHRIWLKWESWLPVVVPIPLGVIVHPSISLDGVRTVLSHAG
jgi:hypothetical protein